MTALEAKKIIEICTDIIKRDDVEFINKEYVLQILDMVDSSFIQPTLPQIGIGTGEQPSNIREWRPDDFYPYGWPKIYYGNKPGCPTDIYGNPVPYCGDNANSTTGNPNEHATIITSDSGEPTHLFKEKFTTTGPLREAAEGTHTAP